MLHAITWSAAEADIVIYGDACLEGLGFYAGDRLVGFYLPVPAESPCDTILFYEELAVCCALQWASTLYPRPKRVFVYTDSKNTAFLFNSYRAKDHYNTLLCHAVDILQECDIDLRVEWLPGKKNPIADAISRNDLDTARLLCPGLTIYQYAPPRSWLEVRRR